MLKISVILPVYNCEKYLDESISSILCQTFKDFELIVINDVSTDRSDSIIRKYLDDSRIVYVENKERKGLVFDLNHGLALSKAEVVARMDADDISVENRFEEQYKFLEKNPEVVMVGSFIELIDEEGRFLRNVARPVGADTIKKVFFYYAPHYHSSIMFRKDVVERIGGYREKYYHSLDIDLFYRLICSGYKTDNVPLYLLKYRTHPDSSDKYYKEKGKTSYRLKRDTIKEFGLKLGVIDRSSVYITYLLDTILTAKQKHKVEAFVKTVVDRALSWSSKS